jgi:hypothetical protein
MKPRGQGEKQMSTRMKSVLPIFVGVLLMALTGMVRADNDNGNIFDRIFNRSIQDSFAGTWDTATLGNNQRTLKMQQNGNNVTGTYSPGNGKIDGKVRNGVLRLNWKQDSGQGTADFTLSPDGQMFSGQSKTADKPNASGSWWNGARHLDPEFGGAWNLVSGGATKYALTLQQTGNKVSGSFAPGNGRIFDGKVSNKTLRFKWTQDGGYVGDGRLKLSDDGQSLDGSFKPTQGPDTTEVSVVASRAPASFHGIWSWKTADTNEDIFSREVYLKQVGDRVNPNDDFTGVVIGNAFFYNWGATGLNHNGVLVMNADGKSFHGIHNFGGDSSKRNIPVVGTFLKPYSSGK